MPRRPPIAITGIGCRFPGHANSPEQFWRLLCNGVDGITDIPRDRFDIDTLYHPDPARPGTLHIRRGGFSDHAAVFDAAFFRISPREAAQMDPQQRMLLEVAWEALEDAGYTQERLAGSRTGVFVGLSTHDFANVVGGPLNRDGIGSHTATGTASSLAANRISYTFDLRGPSAALDTACSSSLTAVHLACQSLLLDECDVAVAGGVNLFLAPESAIGLAKASMLSPDGVCRAFDARANGFVRGEGTGVVVLKRFDAARRDRDRVYALIRGSAINQDGRTTGITAPNGDAQEAMLRDALAVADIDPLDVGYVEAHGTGTVLGDPVEAQAIGRALSAGREVTCPLLIGSVKTNIGHLEAAAGIAGLIKAALSLLHRQIPPHLNLTEPNPAIAFDGLCLKVPLSLQPWPDSTGPAIAGVNSFGFGGANAHVLMQEPPPPETPVQSAVDRDRPRVLVLSASHPESLRQRSRDVAAYLADTTHDLDDVCHTAAVRRSHLEHRLAIVGGDRTEIASALQTFALDPGATTAAVGRASSRRPRLAFVFSGMGPDFQGVGSELFDREVVFRDVIDRCDEVLRPMSGWSLHAALTDASVVARIGEASFAQVANYALQAGLVALLRSWNVVADAVIGHSVGEIAAAHAAGALTLEDGLRLVFHRGRLLDRLSGHGRMLTAALSDAEAERLTAPYDGRISVAAVNSRGSVTLSGETAPMEELSLGLTERGVFNRFLAVRVPYHSRAMDPLRDEFLESIADITPRRATLSISSATTGDVAEGTDFDVAHWWRNLRGCVRFADAATALVDRGIDTFLQVGPHPVLQTYLRECLAARSRQGAVLSTLNKGERETTSLLRSCAALHVIGCTVDWDAASHGAGRCISLPCYPWQHETFGTGREIADRRAGWIGGPDADHPLLGRRLPTARPSWLASLDDARLSYLADHRIGDTPVYPAAAYVEAALAACERLRPGARCSIEQLTFDRMLAFSPSGGLQVQIAWDPDGHFEIHSRSGQVGHGWSRHARGRWQEAASSQPHEPVDLESIRARCAHERRAAELYDRLRQAGLGYEGLFQSIQRAWKGNAEALGRIRLPAPASNDLSAYRVHPSMLDGAFQLLVAAQTPSSGSRSDETFLPAAIERIDVFEPVGIECWVHASISRETASEIEGSVRLITDRGIVIGHLQGIRARRVGTPAHTDRTELYLHELRWIEASWPEHSRPRLLSPAALVESLSNLAPLGADELARVAYSNHVRDELNALAVALIRRGLAGLGCNIDQVGFDVSAVGGSIGIGTRHHRLLARLIQIARAATGPGVDDPEAFEREVADRYGYWADIANLVVRAGKALPDVLRGTREPQEVLFSGHALPVLARAYSKFQSNRVLAELVATAIGDTHRRVLEIGAGTGATTAAVLSRLPVGSCEYCFSDISPFFLAQAKERFTDRPDLSFALFDVEGGTSASLPFEQFDVVIAANVLHGTADVKATLGQLTRILAPDGLLIALELVTPEPWADLIFGLFQGWWRFSDHDRRPTHAALDRGGWLAVLKESGFDAIAAPALEGDPDPIHGVFAAQRTVDTQAAVTLAGARGTWMIVRDRRGIAERLAAALDRLGCASSLADAGRMTAVHDRGIAGIIHLTGVDLPLLDEQSVPQPLEAILNHLTGVTELVRMFEIGDVGLKQLWLITSGAQTLSGDRPFAGGLQMPLWAVGRVLMEELPGVRCRVADVSAAPTEEEIAALAAEIAGERDEDEIAFRGARRFVARMAAVAPATADVEEAERTVMVDPEQVRLEIDEPGNLDSLSIRAVRTEPPAADEILVRVQAAGMNFKDVMHALGLIPFSPDRRSDMRRPLGLECSGVVVAVGDAVEGFRPGDHVCGVGTGTLASHARLQARFAFHKPDRLDTEDAAGVLLPFMTAQFALHHVARMLPRERVLIHSAAGGVGLAAIQLCRNADVEVFATAGSAEKRVFLESLGVEHVMDSRSLDFAERLRRVTHGEGVDVVLNSLAGPAIGKGLSTLRPFGRFIEIGKRDFVENSTLELAPFERHLSFCAVDVDRLMKERPAVFADLAREVLAKFDTAELRPLPRTSFDLADARSAFRHMSQARHIGKIVLTAHRESYQARTTRAQLLFSPDATYLITGGLGGFGLATAHWLVEQGARHIVLVGRHPHPSQRNQIAFDSLMATGAHVIVLAADVADERDVARVLAHIRQHLPRLRGVFHEAMVLEDQRVVDLTPDSWRRVLAPKISGAWNLHRLTERLDHFVLFSSSSVMLGNAGQANYAAANAFLDALAQHRVGLGLPALSVGWGLLGDVGLVVDRHDLQRYFQRIGFGPLTAEEAFAALERLIRRPCVHTMPFRMNWRKLPGSAAADRSRYRDMLPSGAATEQSSSSTAIRTESLATGLSPDADSPDALEAYLRETVARVLGIAREKIDVGTPLLNLGLDSLMAVELESVIQNATGREIPAVRILQGLSVQGLADCLGLQTRRAGPVPSPPHAARKRLPLAPSQRRFWFLQQLDPSSVAYNMPIAIEISGPLDIAALEAAVNEVIRHQEALRATFSIEDEEPVQWIAPELRIPMPLTDIGSAPNGPERLERIMHDESRQSFDLAEGPLISTRLVRVSGGRHVLLATAHHLIVDAWSAAIILRQTAEYYRSFTAGEPQPGGSRSSYSAVVLRQLTSAAERDASQLAYWKRQLQDIEPWRPGALRHMQPSRRVTRSSFELPRPLQNSLEALARREGTTLFTVLLAAFELLVARYSGRDEVCIGTPVTTRIDQESRELVGCFVNTLAIRARMTTSMSFSELVHRTKQTVLAAIEHQDVTWERVVEHINPPRERGRLPFFQALFVLHSFSTKSLELPDLVIRSKLLGTGVSPFELMMIVDSSDGDCAIEYSDAFDSHIASMTHSFITMLEEVVRRPDSLIADLPRPDGHMTVHAVGDSNAPAAEVPCERCLHELFEEQVRRLPDAVAVRSPNDTLSYSQLNVSADALASILRDQRVERGTLVGIALERSPQAIVSMLAVLKAGGAFVPIDPHWPADRVRLILEDTRAVALVTEERFITCRGDCPTIVLDRLESSSRPRHDAGELRAETVPQDLAYVLYTSGSTGRPKGVLIDHAAICHQIAWRQAAFPLGAEDAVLHTTSLTFDPSVWEIFGPLSAGSTVVIAPGAVYDGAAVNHLIRRHGITTLQVVPSVLRSWLARDAFEGCRSLQRVFCGGEPLDATLRTNVFRQVHAELINLYGCTETAIDASWHRCDAHEIGAMTPIGRPIAHTRLYVLDENLRPAPDGLPGELCVAGPGIARGYLNDPELSGQRFIADPVTPSSGLRAFLTGDVVRRLPGGDLEFVERRDRQLKVRGCRIEATEVELALRRHPAVQEAAVGVGCDANGDSLLVAWLVHSGDRPSHAEMRMFLAELLPGFMLPDRYAWVKALPRLASGKSDVRTLADGYEPDGSVRAHTETERALVRLWEDMLGTPGIGINDNFFDLGGHSLLAVRLAARMSKLLGRAVRCGDVMELGTIAAIAASRPADNDAASETLEPREAQKQPM